MPQRIVEIDQLVVFGYPAVQYLDRMSLTVRIATAAPELTPLVECFWYVDGWGSESPSARWVVPDGAPALVLSKGGRPVLFGSQATLQRFASGDAVCGVQLRPEAAKVLLGTDASSFTDRAVPVREVRALRQLGATWTSERSFEEQQEMLTRWLFDLLEASPTAPAELSAAVSQLQRGGNFDVAGVARFVGVTEQQLRRLFLRWVGITPKRYARCARIQSTLCLATRSAGWTWSRVAVEAGFHDQAHLIHEFRALVGVTPNAWRRAGGEWFARCV